MENIIIIAVLAAIVGFASFYIYKEKKSGTKCIGCPAGGSCNCGCSGGESSCGCGCNK